MIDGDEAEGNAAVREWISSIEPDALFADGFDAAVIGLGERCSQPMIVVYDVGACLDVLKAQGLEHEEAVEFFHFNVAGAWVGEHTPLFVHRYQDADA